MDVGSNSRRRLELAALALGCLAASNGGYGCVGLRLSGGTTGVGAVGAADSSTEMTLGWVLRSGVLGTGMSLTVRGVTSREGVAAVGAGVGVVVGSC